MTIGDLRDVVTIQAPSAGQDAIGEPVAGWTDFVTLRAGVRDLTGRELIAANAIQSQITTAVTIRFRNGVLPAMRVLRGDEVYVIEAVLNPTGRRDWLVLMCVKGRPDA